MLSRRTWCARALLTLLAGLPLVTPMALLTGRPGITLLALLTLRTLLSRGPWLRSCACVATANEHG
jgi:hypothetical protein